MLKELVEVIVKQLVDKPDQVSVSELNGKSSTIVELKVASEDLGKVIGKAGKTARAIRTIVHASAAKLNKRVVLEILE
jgi:uncharacterized protein